MVGREQYLALQTDRSAFNVRKRGEGEGGGLFDSSIVSSSLCFSPRLTFAWRRFIEERNEPRTIGDGCFQATVNHPAVESYHVLDFIPRKEYISWKESFPISWALRERREGGNLVQCGDEYK